MFHVGKSLCFHSLVCIGIFNISGHATLHGDDDIDLYLAQFLGIFCIQTFQQNFILIHQNLTACYPLNSADMWLQALQTKRSEKVNCFFSLHWAVENSDHALLCIINIWAFGLLYLPPNEKQRSALEGLARFRQWKTGTGKKKKSSQSNSNHLCAQGTWGLCLDKLAMQKNWDDVQHVVCWCGMRWPFAW